MLLFQPLVEQAVHIEEDRTQNLVDIRLPGQGRMAIHVQPQIHDVPTQ